MARSIERGFSMTELVVVLSLLCVAFLCACQGVLGEKGKEAETKANLHTIQIALERYATDHSGWYPAYLLGGDVRGWDSGTGCRALIEPESEDLRPPCDPLIHFAYMYSYPDNPFIRSGEGLRKIVARTGSRAEDGYGDVRFGWSGEVMGNCLDDPRYLFESQGVPSRYQYTMLPDSEAGVGVLREGAPNSFYCMGGLPNVKNFWPGHFFYRCAGEYFLDEHPARLGGKKYEVIWGWPYLRITRYMLGCYGSTRTEGMDVIRLTTKEGLRADTQLGAITGVMERQYYQDHDDPSRPASHPDFNLRIKYSNPEVFGRGEQGLMPQFPCYVPHTLEWMFGAPDGYPDGVILVLTSELGSVTALEWRNGEVVENPD